LIGALTDGLKANTTAAELQALAVQTGEMAAIMKAFGEAKEGGVVTLDFVDGATKIGLNGEMRGSIDGEAFNRALTRIWIGEHPVQDDLKKAMLGGA
jgi:long-chain acyl-CoA synthetase